MGVEPTASLVLSQGGLPVAYRAGLFSVPRAGVEPAKPEGGWVTATGARQCPADAYSSGSGGGRTHSIPGSKPGWSANCLPSRRFVSTQSRDRTCKHPGLSRAALPIGVSGHGRSSPGGTRTPDRLLVRELPSPLGHRTVWKVRVCDRSSRHAYSSAEGEGLEPPSGSRRRLFSRQVPHPAGCLPSASCGGWT